MCIVVVWAELWNKLSGTCQQLPSVVFALAQTLMDNKILKCVYCTNCRLFRSLNISAIVLEI